MNYNRSILISHLTIPTNEIGSWNVLLTDLLKKEQFFFDNIISPLSVDKIDGVNIAIKTTTIIQRILSKFDNVYLKKNYWNSLQKVINNNPVDDFNIIVFDDLKIVFAIDKFAKKCNLRKRIRILFYLHGYEIGLNLEKRTKFYSCIDKLIVLTESSYVHQINSNHTIPCEVELLSNGIDSQVFHPVDVNQKNRLKKKFNLSNDIIYFLWVSQDRPKKGLSIILKAWSKLYKKHKNIELLVIGTHEPIIANGVKWFSRRPNKEIKEFYQLTDYYIFSSLCHEGHSLSLTEAIKCNAKCIVSDIDPNSEIIKKDKYGILVTSPNMVESWTNTIEGVLSGVIIFNKYNANDIFRKDEWILNFKKTLL
jgi:glycosyltransferase involved in cell wall biosynthesis